MPRGRAPGYELQREAIVARAAELFARQGYSGTSMNQVAEACGISKPSLYHYVDDKYQLLVEIAQGHVDRLRALVKEAPGAAPPTPEAKVRELIVRFMGAYADAQNAHRVLTEDVRFLAPKDQRRVLDGEREVVDAFARAIAAARPDLAQAKLQKPLTMLLFGMMNWMFTWLRPGGPLGHAEMTPIVADLFFGGLHAVRAPGASGSPNRSASAAMVHPRTRAGRAARETA